MSCTECRNQLMDYILGDLPVAQLASVRAHLGGCSRCMSALQEAQSLRAALMSQQPIPPASADFQQRVLAAATTGQGMGAARHRWTAPWMGAAVAAAMVLGIAIGLGLQPLDDVAPDRVAATVEPAAAGNEIVATEAGPTMKTVRLAFNAREPMENVTLTLELPPNVELDNYPGHHQLSWQVDLKAGENVLALPLRVLWPDQTELVARLDDGQRQKTFRAAISAINPMSKTDLDREPSS